MKLLLSILTCLILTASHAQHKFNLFAGLSSTIINVSSDSEIQNPYHMGIGEFLGGAYEQNKWLSYELLFEYSQIKLRNEIQFTSGVGSDVGSAETFNRFFNIQLGALCYKKFNKLKIAGGLNLQYSLYSNVIYKSDYFNNYKANNSVRPYNIVIPLEASYPLGAISIMIRYERAILNRLLNSNTTKEFENDLRLGVSYQFN